MTQITVASFVSEPNCISVNELVGKALYGKISDDSLDDILVGAHLTQDEKSLTIHQGNSKVFIVHAVLKIMNEETLECALSPAFKVDEKLFNVFKERFPELASL